jgi:signal transduction histidine kinase
MMSGVTPPLRRGLGAALTSAALLAGVTALIALLEPGVPAVGLGVLYLFAVAPIALRYGLVAAVATSLVGIAAFDFLFLGVRNTFDPGRTGHWDVLVALLAAALVVSALAARAQRDARRSARLADEQAALRRVATLVAQAVPPGELFEAVTREVGQLCGADLARIERYEDDGTVTALAAWASSGEAGLAVGTRFSLEGASIALRVRETGRPARVDSFVGAEGPIAREAQGLGIRASIGCPIIVGGRVWGVIAASTRRDVPFAAGTESQIAEFTELIATAVSNAEASAELVASRARILTTADDARRRLARDLHDGAQQRLVHTIVTLKLAQRELPEDNPAAPIVAEALAQAEQGNAELRELAHGVLPSVLTRRGLRAGVDTLVARVGIPVAVQVPAERLPPGIEASAYFIVAEALTNVVKHAQAQTAQVTARVERGALHVDVRDDGVGGAHPDGPGLLGLEDRISAIGGGLQVHSPPGGGTTIAATLPLPAS